MFSAENLKKEHKKKKKNEQPHHEHAAQEQKLSQKLNVSARQQQNNKNAPLLPPGPDGLAVEDDDVEEGVQEEDGVRPDGGRVKHGGHRWSLI